MNNGLPPLKSLLAFSTVAKTLSFTKAAEMLHISQSGVSHQIKNLEKHLGCKLFVRQGNQIVLSEEGSVLAQTVNPAFERIGNTCKELSGQMESAIQFGVISAYAAHRLTPQLAHFSELDKGLDLRLKMLTCSDDPRALDLDILLLDKRLESVSYDCECFKLEAYYPVAVPAVAESLKGCPPEKWHERSHFIELEDIDGWQIWFEHNRIPWADGKMQRFGNTLLMLQAAISGQGIALLGETLIAEQLELESLVKLVDTPMTFGDDGFYFCIHNRRRKDPDVRIVRNWLKSLMV